MNTIYQIIISLLIFIAILIWESMPPAECKHWWEKANLRYRVCVRCNERQKLDRCDIGPLFWTIVPSVLNRRKDVHYI